MERESAKQLLASRGWLSLLPDAVREEILARLILRKYAKGQMIYTVGDPPGGMFGLVAGSLAIVSSTGDVSPHYIHTALPGFWFGEGAVVTGEPRRVGASARTDLALLHLPMAAALEIVAADPTTWRWLALNAVLNLDLALRAFDDMKQREPHVRLAAILLRLAGYQTPLFAGEGPCRVEISQTELAEMSGLSRNVVNRVLARLAEETLVEVGYGHIDLPQPLALVAHVQRSALKG